MAFFESFKDFIDTATKQGETLFARFTTTDQLDRLTAACCLIAYADGVCSSEEKRKVRGIIGVKLPHFDSKDIAESWKKAEDVLNVDLDFGKDDLIIKIKKAEGDEATMIAKAMCLVGAADGDFDDKEKAIAREVITALNLKPSEFGLS
jgi:tellurite resistance protein TerB